MLWIFYYVLELKVIWGAREWDYITDIGHACYK